MFGYGDSFFLGGRDRSAGAVRLVLAGVVVSALFGAMSNFIIYIASDAEGMRSVAFWTMESLAGARWDTIFVPLLISLLGLMFFLSRARELNAFLLGEEIAVTLGVDLTRERRIYLIFAALLTGVIVASCGIFGFVGLVIPHIMRALLGTNHRLLIPGSAFGGAVFMIWADFASRILLPGGDLPIGILTAIVGAPFFMHLLFRSGSGLGL